MVWGICNILQDYWGSRGWRWLLFVVISVLTVFPVFAVGAPEAPTNLQVSPGYSSAVLTWTETAADPAITSYQYSSDDGTTWNTITGSGAGTTSYTATGLTLGGTYTFKVRTLNSGGVGTASTGVPVIIFGLQASTYYEIAQLTWTQPSDNANIAKYQYKQGSGTWRDIARSDSTTVSHTVTGLTPNTAYTFAIQALDSSNTSLSGPNTIVVVPNKIANYPFTNLSLSSGDNFGSSVALSDDGSLLAVGAHGDNTSGSGRGAVHLFEKTGSTWTHIEEIAHGTDGLSLSDLDHFGIATALSEDGTLLAIGAYGDDTDGENRGAVHLFEKTDTSWTYAEKIDSDFDGLSLSDGDRFGISTALSADGTQLAVGAYRDNTGGDNRGAVHLFEKTDTAWTQVKKIAHETDGLSLSDNDFFGRALALSDDGTLLAVGAYGDSTGGDSRGAVHLFTKSNDTWAHSTTINNSFTGLTLVDEGSFGVSVALSDNGAVLVVGAYKYGTGGNSRGAVHLFEKSGTAWTHAKKIAHETDGLSLGNSDHFGSAVALSDDGAILTVGAYRDNTGGSGFEEGAIYTFKPDWHLYISGNLGDQNYTEDKTIPPLTLPEGRFGDGTYSYTLTGLPGGLSFDQNTRVLSGAPERVGSSTVTYTVRDGSSPQQTASRSFSITVAEKPKAPTDVQVLPGYTSAVLTWVEVPADPVITSYQYSSDNGVVWNDIPGSRAGTTGYTVTNLTPGETYTFKVRAIGEGIGSASTGVPIIIFGLRASTYYETVQLAWTQPSNNADIARYRYKQGSESWQDIPGSDTTTTSHTITGLTPNIAHSFTIRAIDSSNASLSESHTITPIPNKIDGTFTDLSLGRGDNFGVSTALSGDGTQLAVGAYRDDTGGVNRGAVYLFEKNGLLWTRTAKIDSTFSSLSLGNGDHFGSSVAFSGDGTLLAVGALGDNTDGDDRGAVHLFEKNETTWTHIAKIDSTLNGLSLSNSGYFGSSAALSDDGTQLAVGAYLSNVNGDNQGAVYLFEKNETAWTHTAKIDSTLSGLSLNNLDYFGGSVALSDDGTLLAVGAYNDDDGGIDKGAVYLFEKNETTWAHTEMVAHGTGGLSLSNYDHFGGSVALSDDGSLLAVGAYKDDTGGDGQGAMHLFIKTDSTWMRIKKIAHGTDGLSLNNNDNFGIATALSDDGTLLIIGAFGDDTGGSGEQGAVYTFKPDLDMYIAGSVDDQVYIQGREITPLTLPGGKFGVGAYSYTLGLPEGLSFDQNTRVLSGTPKRTGHFTAIYVVRDSGSPQQVESISFSITVATKPRAPANMQVLPGYTSAVLTWVEAPTYPAVSAYQYSSDDGATWNTIAGSGVGTTSHTVTGLTLGGGYTFKVRAVNIGGDGAASTGVPVIILGLQASTHYETVQLSWTQPGDNADIAKYQYKQGGGTWRDIAGSDNTTVSHTVTGLTPNTAYTFAIRARNSSNVSLGAPNTTVVIPNKIDATHADFSLSNGDNFGKSVALSDDGTLLAVGAHWDNTGGSGQGAVHLFEKSGPTWKHIRKIANGTGGLSLNNYDYFGGSVALSDDGTLLAVGAHGDNTGGPNRGAVHLFEKTDTAWMHAGTVAHGTEGLSLSNSDYFGVATALSDDGTVLAVGAHRDDTGGAGQGAVYLFEKNGTTWTHTVKIDGAFSGLSLNNFDYFGSATALSDDGTVLAVGAYRNDISGYTKGAVHLFRKKDSVWTYTGKVAHGTGDFSLDDRSHFGGSVALSDDGTLLAVGAYLNDLRGASQGAVHLFQKDGSTWTHTKKIANGTDGLSLNNRDYFGRAFALSGDGALLTVGAGGDDGSGYNQGAVYTFKPDWNMYIAGNVDDQIYIKDQRITPLTLPKGGFGDGTYSYTLTGLPGGLSFDQNTRVLSGAPEQAGPFTATYTVQDSGTPQHTASFSFSITVAAIPRAPADLQASLEDGYVWLRWTGVPADPVITSYQYSSDDGVSWNAIPNSRSGTTSYSVENLTPGGTYTFRVRAVNSGGAGVASEGIPIIAYGLQVSTYHKEVQLTWTRPIDTTNIAKYQYKWDRRWRDIPGSSSTTTSHTITNLAPNAAYSSIIRALDSNNASLGESPVIIFIPNKIGGVFGNPSLENVNYFGSATALSNDGTVLAVGALGDSTGGNYRGAVHLFEKTGITWMYTTKIAHGTAGLSLSDNDNFGNAVALSNDGTLLAVGAYRDNTGGDYRGAVHLFQKNGTAWTYLRKVAHGTAGLSLSDNDRFGSSVAFSDDGTLLAVGAFWDGTGGAGRGAVHLFEKNGTTWVRIRTIAHGTAGLSLNNNDHFGSSVTFSDDDTLLAVGAYKDDTSGYNRGAVHFFEKTRIIWRYTETIAHGTGGLSLSNDDQFGNSVALSDDGTLLAVGAYRSDTSEKDQGAVYLFQKNGSVWTQVKKIAHGTNSLYLHNFDRFGDAVALSGDGALLTVGVSGDAGGGYKRGGMYTLKPNWNLYIPGSVGDKSYKEDDTITSLTLPEGKFGNGTHSYTLIGLPEGLSFEQNTRVLSGAPTEVGSFTATYTVRDSGSSRQAASLSFSIVVFETHSVELKDSSDSGVLGDGITSDGTPTVTVSGFTSDASVTVTVRQGDRVVVTEGRTGNGDVELGTLSDGEWNITASDGTNTSNIFTITIDDVEPTVTLNGGSQVTLVVGDTYTEEGVSTNEGVVSITGTVNTAEPGTYTVTYLVTDEAGNTSTAERIVIVNPTVPSAVTNLSASPVATAVTLSWTTPSDGGSPITGYRINPNNEGWADIPNSDAETTQHTVTGLTSETAYSFKVKPVNTIGEGAESNMAAVTTLDVTVPSVQSQTLTTSNANSTYAKVGDTLTLSFTVSETLAQTPSVTIAGVGSTAANSRVLVTGSGNTYTATHEVAGETAEGPVTYKIGTLTDLQQNTFNPPVMTSGVTVDKTAPTAPTNLDLHQDDDSGRSGRDNFTKVTRGLTIAYAAEHKATVQLKEGAADIGTATTGMSQDIDLDEGVHSITATATDQAGNTSVASAVLQITVDTTGPTLSGASSISETESLSPEFTFTVNGLDSGEAALITDWTVGGGRHCGSETINIIGSPDADGNQRVTIVLTDGSEGDDLLPGDYTGCAFRVQDAAGNKSAVLDIPAFAVLNPAPIFQTTAIDKQTYSFRSGGGMSIVLPRIQSGTGNGTITYTLTPDPAVPASVGITYTAPTLYTDGSLYSIGINVSDAVAGVYTYTYTAEDAKAQSVSLTFTVILTNFTIVVEDDDYIMSEQAKEITATADSVEATDLKWGIVESLSDCSVSGSPTLSDIYTSGTAVKIATEDANTKYACFRAIYLDDIYYAASGQIQGIDHTPPNAPTNLDLHQDDDRGLDNADDITKVTTGLTISYTAEQGTTVQMKKGAADIGTATTGMSQDIDLDEGVHSITATATDQAGNTSAVSAALTITIDAVEPTVVLNGGSRVTLVVGDTYTEEGAVTNEGVVSITGTVDTAESGTYTVTYSATDEAGNTGTAERIVTVNPTVPGAITNLSASPVVTAVTLSWTTPSDGGSPITGYRINRNDEGWEDIPNSDAEITQHTVTGLTSETVYSFRVKPVNAVGEGAEAFVTTTTTDGTTPTVASFSPAGTVADSRRPVITVTFSEAVYADTSETVLTDTAVKSGLITLIAGEDAVTAYTASINAANTVITITPTADLANGAVSVTVNNRYYDRSGNHGSTATHIFAVVVIVPLPAQVNAVLTDSPPFAGGDTYISEVESDVYVAQQLAEASDALDGITFAYALTDSETACSRAAPYRAAIPTVGSVSSDGTYKVCVRAGNTEDFIYSASREAVFTVDMAAPTITVDAITPTGSAQSKSVTVSAADTNLKTNSIRYVIVPGNTCSSVDIVDGSAGVPYTGAVTLNQKEYNTRYVCFRTEDLAGNSAYAVSEQISGIVDPLVIAVIDDNYAIPEQSKEITVTLTDTTATDRQWGIVNRTSDCSASGRPTLSNTYDSGDIVSINSEDSNGKVACFKATQDDTTRYKYSGVIRNIDRVAPEVAYTTDAGDFFKTGDTLRFTVTARDANKVAPGTYSFTLFGAATETCLLTVNTPVVEATGTCSVAVTGTIEGRTITVVAPTSLRDIAGNMGTPVSHSLTPRVDLSAPVITSLGEPNTSGRGQVTLSLTAVHHQDSTNADLPETVRPIFGGDCLGFETDTDWVDGTPTDGRANTYRVTISARSGSYSNCTVKLADEAGNESNVAVFDAFTVRSSGGGGGGSASRTTGRTAGNTRSLLFFNDDAVEERVGGRNSFSGVATLVPQVFTRDLSVGSTGEDVRQLQVFLNQNDHVLADTGPGSPGSETAYYGERTRAAKQRYQVTHGIQPTVEYGHFGFSSRTQVNTALSTRPLQTFARDLSVGSTGEDVRRLQVFLNRNDHVLADTGPGSPGNETAYYGERTRAAKQRYQVTHGIQPTVEYGHFGFSSRAQVNNILSTQPLQTFARDLSVGSTGEDVRRLQVFLNRNDHVLADTGPGSPGNETAYYGERTRAAKQRYQITHGIQPTVEYGHFGFSSRAQVNNVLNTR